MKYAVKFPHKSIEKKFLKFLNNIPSKQIQNQVKEKTMSLASNPRPYGEPKIKPPIEIYNYAAQYRLRIADYRVLYDVDEESGTVWILAIRKRNERTYN